MPSIVTTSAPSACTANMRHARTASPSTSTVHAPHTPCSHPRWVPVSVQSSRRKSARVLRGSTNARRTDPLTFTLTGTSGTGGLLEGGANGGGDQVGGHPLAVAATGVDVVGRVELGGDGLADLLKGGLVEVAGGSTRKGGLGRGGSHRGAADAEQADAR